MRWVNASYVFFLQWMCKALNKCVMFGFFVPGRSGFSRYTYKHCCCTPQLLVVWIPCRPHRGVIPTTGFSLHSTGSSVWLTDLYFDAFPEIFVSSILSLSSSAKWISKEVTYFILLPKELYIATKRNMPLHHYWNFIIIGDLICWVDVDWLFPVY